MRPQHFPFIVIEIKYNTCKNNLADVGLGDAGYHRIGRWTSLMGSWFGCFCKTLRTYTFWLTVGSSTVGTDV